MRLFHVHITYTDQVDKATTAAQKAWVKERGAVTFPLNIENMECGGLLPALDQLKARVDRIEGFNTSFDYLEAKRQLQSAIDRGNHAKAEELRRAIAEIEAKNDVGVGTTTVRRTTHMRSAPPILTLRIQRVQLSADMLSDYKMHCRFDYPEELDMAGFLHKPAGAEETRYRLYGIVAHRGTSQSGHYMCFIRPPGQSIWYKFDDDKVARVDAAEAVEGNFGLPGQPARSAYMLIYLRMDDEGQCTFGLEDAAVPDHVTSWLDGPSSAEQPVLPIAITLALPTGKGLKKLRGTVKEVAVAGGAEATVEDLVRALQAQMAAEGTPVKLPSEGELYAGDTARAALASYPFAPQLCLTLVKEHKILRIYDMSAALNMVQGQGTRGLLRMEWRDVRTGVGCVRVAQAQGEKVNGLTLHFFGDPVLLPLLPGDTLERALARLQRRTGWKWNMRGDEVQYAHIVHSQTRQEFKLLQLDQRVDGMIAADTPDLLVVMRTREEGSPGEGDFLAAQEQRRASRSRIRMPAIDNAANKKKSKAT